MSDDQPPIEQNDGPLSGLVPFELPRSRLARSCAACEFGVKEDKDRVCRKNPPQVSHLAVPMVQPGTVVRPPQQGIQIISQTQFPVVRDDQWCGAFQGRGAK